MNYLLDTDHISILQLRAGAEYAKLSARIARHAANDLAFSIISFQEQVLGSHTFIARARSIGEIIRGYRLLEGVPRAFWAAPVLPFDNAAATIVDNLRVQRIRMATMDLRIASIALAHRLILLTRNIGDFSKVPGLVTDDWTS